MPAEGEGYQLMRLSRNRFYGHPLLLDYLKELARDTHATNHMLLIGDMAQPRGGPMSSGHSSHQLGLEADIWYWHPPQAEKASLTLIEREETSALSLVHTDGKTLAPLWQDSYGALLRRAAEPEEVDRIFVHPAIKKSLCSQYHGEAWLRKIRPWWKHDDHFHVRLKCPIGSACTPQSPIPAGDGCDATLEWWFTPEAAAKPVVKEAKKAALPERCMAVLQSR
jgi:penicillin-insensitive murein DD-endopeptidase